MNKSKYIEKCNKKLNKYELSNIEYSMLITQIKDVVLQCQGDPVKTLGKPEDLVLEMLDLNDIDPITRTSYTYNRSSFDWTSKIFGIVFIVAAIVFLTSSISIWDIVIFALGVGFILNGIKELLSRNFILALIFLVLGASFVGFPLDFISTYLGISLFSLIIAALLIVIGLKLLFSGRRRYTSYENYTQYNSSSFNTNDENINGTVVTINNKLGSFNRYFTTEEITIINFTNSLGNSVIDLSNFEFKSGDLLINVDVNLGSSTILTPRNSLVTETITSTNGKVTNLKVNSDEYEYQITISGYAKNGSLTIK